MEQSDFCACGRPVNPESCEDVGTLREELRNVRGLMRELAEEIGENPAAYQDWHALKTQETSILNALHKAYFQ